MSENALITNADMIFDDISGTNGRNFRLKLDLETVYGGVSVNFNPLRLPQLLQQLNLEQFSDLIGTYVQIPETRFGEEVKGIKSILAKDDEEWFKTENSIYFGSEFTGEEDLKKENEELKQENKELKGKLEVYRELYPSGKWICDLNSDELKKELEE